MIVCAPDHHDQKPPKRLANQVTAVCWFLFAIDIDVVSLRFSCCHRDETVLKTNNPLAANELDRGVSTLLMLIIDKGL